MAGPAKSKPVSRSEPPAKAAVTSKKRATNPSLRFHCSEDLSRKTCKVLDTLERAKDPVQHRDALAEVVVALTSQGLDAFYLEPLKRAKTGFVTQQSASLGMAGARQVMGSVIHNIIVRMDGPQLISVCGSIRDFML
jgi:hypothetical protein